MKSFWIVFLIVTVFLLHVIPEVLVLLFAWKQSEEKNFIKKFYLNVPLIIVSAFVNFIIILGFHLYYWGYKNIFVTLKNLCTFSIYSQDMEYFAASSMACFLAMLLIGVLFWDKRKLISQLRKNLIILFGTISILVITVIFYYGMSAANHIVLNEICSNNRSIYLDSDYSTDDYIELYNPDIFPCRLDNLFLSDDLDNLQKVGLEDYVIEAKGFILIRLNGGADSFSVDKTGEMVYLSNSVGRIIDAADGGEMPPDTAYCRTDDGSDVWGYFTCTPYETNGNAMVAEEVNSPVFSHNSGFFETAFDLELTSDPGTTIYYTLDGSVPNMDSYQYSEPIYVYNRSKEQNVFRSIQNVVLDYDYYIIDETPIDKAFIISAIAVNDKGISSKSVTATYFVDLDKYRNQNVISLVAEPDALFGDEGIYVTGREYDEWYRSNRSTDEPEANFEKYGREREAKASLQFLSQSLNYEQEVGIRIMGGTARTVPLKRLSVFARKDYSGSKWITVPLDDGKEVHSFMLREGFANAFLPSIVADRDISVQDAAPVTLFLNGEYWYDTYLIEKYNEEYFSQKYNVREDNVILYKNGNLENGKEADSKLYSSLYDYLNTHDMAKEESYQEFCSMVDIQSYIDSWCFHLYINNLDIDERKNSVLWRTRNKENNPYGDCLWRWALYDLDAAEWDDIEDYGVTDRAEINTFTQETKYAGSAFNKKEMYAALSKNEKFCEQFVLTFMDMINTDFSVEHVSEVLEEWGSDISWNDAFFEKRAQYIVPDMAEEFGLSGTLEEVTLYINDEAGGKIELNTIIPDMQDGAWSGNYYTDYPVSVRAIANTGYEFAGWSGDVMSSDESVKVEVKKGGVQLNAVFQKVE